MTSPPPAITTLTAAMYGSLPEVYRAADAAQSEGANGYPLLRYLASFGDVAQFMDDLYFRLAYVPPDQGGPLTGPGSTSDLVDPKTADEGWLSWLAQLVGVRLDPALPLEARRASVAAASTGRLAGTQKAIAAAAQSALTGTKSVQVLDHTVTTATSMQPGSQWDVTIVTRQDETPDIDAVLDAVVRARAKPAGVKLWHFTYAASWARLEAAWPTWSALRGAGSWEVIENASAASDNGTGSDSGLVTPFVKEYI